MNTTQASPAATTKSHETPPSAQLYVRGALRRRINKKPDGNLIVESHGTRVKVLEVIDVSRAGIRLKIGHLLEAPAPVILHYQTSAMSMQLNGTICWQAPADDSSDTTHLIGIELIGPSLLVDQL